MGWPGKARATIVASADKSSSWTGWGTGGTGSADIGRRAPDGGRACRVQTHPCNWKRYHSSTMAAKLGPLLQALWATASPAGATPFDASAPAFAAVQTWLELLQQWNERTDLTAARSPEELVDLMLADALVLAGRLESGARIVDIGTGAGAPGLALALLRPDLRTTLVESSSKRVSFLRTVLGSVRRTDVVV